MSSACFQGTSFKRTLTRPVTLSVGTTCKPEKSAKTCNKALMSMFWKFRLMGLSWTVAVGCSDRLTTIKTGDEGGPLVCPNTAPDALRPASHKHICAPEWVIFVMGVNSQLYCPNGCWGQMGQQSLLPTDHPNHLLDSLQTKGVQSLVPCPNAGTPRDR